MNTLDPEICRRARLARDPRFDGEFFLAVTTTGIYCRPICPARSPRESNVRYFRSAAEAAGGGFRPCLRCRPESAPDSPAWQGTSTTVRRALQMINRGELNHSSTGQLAERLGVGERYLRKLFSSQLGASPTAVAQTRRLHFAQKLLRETDMSITDIAYASGFRSTRRFNSAVREQFDCTPGELRNRGAQREPEGICLELGYRPPLDWDSLLDFFQRHAIDGIETVIGDSYRKHFETNGRAGRFKISPSRKRNILLLRLELSDTRDIMPVAARVRRMFDLDANPGRIASSLGADPALRPLLDEAPGVRSPVHFSAFESCVRGIVGQQISLPAARKVLSRIAATCADRSGAEPGQAFPSPSQVAALPDSELPMPNARKQTLRAACLLFEGTDLPEQELCEQLGALRGIGPWTLEMLRMRGFGEPDVFPTKDLGLLKAIAARGIDPATPAAAYTQHWRPWRSYAANLLWRSLK